MEHKIFGSITHYETTVSLNQRIISLIYVQRKNFFELKKVFLIHKNCLWSKEIVWFALKNILLNQQNFLQFEEKISLTVYQRNVTLIQKNCFLGVNHQIFDSITHTEKTVSLNQRIISSIYGQRKHFIQLKKVFSIQKTCLWSKEIDLFTLKKIFLNLQNFLQFKKIFVWPYIQRNVTLIQRNCFLDVNHQIFGSITHTEKTVSLNQRVISLIYGQRKHFFDLKKVLLIQKNCLWSKEIDWFTLKNIFWNLQNFLQFQEIFSLTVYQRNVSLIQRDCFLDVSFINPKILLSQ